MLSSVASNTTAERDKVRARGIKQGGNTLWDICAQTAWWDMAITGHAALLRKKERNKGCGVDVTSCLMSTHNVS